MPTQLVKGRPWAVLFGLVYGLGALSALAQVEGAKPQSYVVVEYVLKPEKIAEFEAAWKDRIAECKRQNYYLPIYVYSMDDFHLFAFYPVQAYSGIDHFMKAHADFEDGMGVEKLQRIREREYASVEYYKKFLIRFREDLSFRPETPKYKIEQDRFVHWGLCYVQPGQDKKFEESFKAIKNLYAKKNLKDIDYGADVYVGDIGTEMPFYFFSESGESKGHFWTQAEKRHQAVGQELFEIFYELLASCRKFEMYGGWFRPDLSYIAGEK